MQTLQREVWKCLASFHMHLSFDSEIHFQEFAQKLGWGKMWKAIHKPIRCNSTCTAIANECSHPRVHLKGTGWWSVDHTPWSRCSRNEWGARWRREGINVSVHLESTSLGRWSRTKVSKVGWLCSSVSMTSVPSSAPLLLACCIYFQTSGLDWSGMF